MKNIAILVAAMFATGSALADTIELADGRLLEGDFVGSSNGIIMFNTGEGIEAFPEAEVVGMWFSEGVATREAEMGQTGPAPTLSVPAGTRLVVRMSDSVDSRNHGAGHRFRGQRRLSWPGAFRRLAFTQFVGGDDALFNQQGFKGM